MLAKTRNKLSLILCAFGASACVTIHDMETCSVAGDLSAGAICAHTNTNQTSDKTFDEFISWLEPESDANGNPVRAAAVCVSSEDYKKAKIELETMCRMLGSRCKYEVQK